MRTSPEQVYNLFFHPGEVVEIRIAGLKGERKDVYEGRAWGADAWVFGYFDNVGSFSDTVNKLEKAGATAVYFTPNPPRPELIHRVNNRLVLADKKRTLTSNHEIKCIRWLLIDLDPSKRIRPAGISSSEKDLEYAKALGKTIKSWLADTFGFSNPIGAMSGNGYHMMYRLPDLPNEIPKGKAMSEASQLVKQCLAAIEDEFKDPNVDVDQQVFNAARIWKLYGTIARKGESSAERPHRRSFLFSSAPMSLDQVEAVPIEKIKELAAKAPESAKSPSPGAPVPAKKRIKKGKTQRYKDEWGELDVGAWLAAYGIQLHSTEVEGNMTKFILKNCLFNESHKAKDAMLFKAQDGPVGYKCLHSSCAGYGFKDARLAVSGTDSLKEFMTGYDPSFERESQPVGSGALTTLSVIPETTFKSISDLPSPEDIDPSEFFTLGPTNRPRFTVKLMSNYLAAYAAPLCFTNGVFWRYSDGVWGIFPDGKLNQMISQALNEKVQPDWISGTIRILQADLNREEDEWPDYPDMINVKNGMIDLSCIQPDKMEDFDLDKLLISHDPKYGSRVQLNAEYDVDSYTETRYWFRALNEIFPEGRPVEHGEECVGDEKIRLLKQFAGYMLLPTTKYERCLMMYGGGANGKGTIMDTLTYVLGEDNATELSIDDLGKSFNLPYLQTKMLVTCAELPHKDSGSGIQKLKQCISGDMISGELKFGRRVDFRNKAKFCFAVNLPPTITDKSYGLYRKLLVLNFTRRFKEEERNKELRKKLQNEKNGIFLWMLDGAIDLIQNKGFVETNELVKEKNLFFKMLNPLLMFVDEKANLGDQYFTPKTVLYLKYQDWCKETLHKSLGRTNFYLQLETHFGLKSARRELPDGSTPHCFMGIGLKDHYYD